MSKTFSSLYKNILYLTITNKCNATPWSVIRGKGYRLPLSHAFPKLKDGFEPTASDVLEVVEGAYIDGRTPPSDIIFDNTLGEPLMRLPIIIESAQSIKEKRHGVPITVRTNGLSGATGASELAKADPGDNFKVKNLHVEVQLAAHNPSCYLEIMQPNDSSMADGVRAFSEVCSFVATAVEELGSDAVTCVVVDRPECDVRAAKALASSIGAGHFEVLDYIDFDHYDSLGVTSDASTEEIKEAYRSLALKLHPDRRVSDSSSEDDLLEEQFSHISNAYKILIDEKARKLYDQGTFINLV
eukprot:g5890.t1